MKKENLIKVFDECERTGRGIRVELCMPNLKESEIVINGFNSLYIKKNYYNRNFNDELVNIKNNKIKIIDAQPIQIKYVPKRVTLFKEV